MTHQGRKIEAGAVRVGRNRYRATVRHGGALVFTSGLDFLTASAALGYAWRIARIVVS